MEYTKDMILNVKYGQDVEKHKLNIFKKVSNAISKHRFMAVVISMTLMLMLLDIMLVTSFVNILSNI